ncbi:MAG: hypothetical protein ACI4A3_03435 [Lachnospiraceae bacterium]
MHLFRRLFLILIPIIGLVYLFGNGNTAQAKRYYSLEEIGLSGCTLDNVDYAILSIRGNTIRYTKYQIANGSCEWKQIGDVQTARLTSKTKYYMGDLKKIPDSLRKNGMNENNKNINNKNINNNKEDPKIQKTTNKRHLSKKNIDTEKWIYRVRKGSIKKNLSGRNNEIQIQNGKVIKLVINLAY